MKLIIDTREHKSELTRICGQLDELRIVYERHKLDVGDYQIEDKPELVIDRKKDLLEICGNITQQHKRFRAELLRAVKRGIQLIILCEHGEGVERPEDVYFWHNPRRDIMTFTVKDGRPCKVPKYPNATDGPQLYKAMKTMETEYGIRFLFCDKSETGKRIIELLEGGP